MSGSAREVLLVVDDDDDIRLALKLLFESEGFVVEEAENGEVALQLLAGGLRPRLILLDLMMPVMNGWTFREHQQASAELRDIPVLVFSAVESGARAVEGVIYLRKPMSPVQLLDAVREIASV